MNPKISEFNNDKNNNCNLNLFIFSYLSDWIKLGVQFSFITFEKKVLAFRS